MTHVEDSTTWLGNTPQALSHLAVIGAATALSKAQPSHNENGDADAGHTLK